MSMIGEYLRVTPAQLVRALDDPDWASEHLDQVRVSEEGKALTPADTLQFDTYKAWDLLGFLLRRSAFPVDIIHGEATLAEDNDWGYGPPRYLTAEQVKSAAVALLETRYDDLVRGVHHSELAEAKVYPQMWDSPASLEWARPWFEHLAEFFQAAAHANHAMLVWLD